MVVRSLAVTVAAALPLAIGVAPGWAGTAPVVEPEVRSTLKDCSKRFSSGKVLCGRLEVPVDRADPSLGTTRVSFAYRPADRQPARRVTLVTDGPWVATTAALDFLAYGATGGGAQMENRDVIFVDSRLTGRNRIDCPLLQKAGNDLAEATKQCIDLIGPMRDHLAYADHADDVEDVRRHLLGDDAPKVDFSSTGHATPLAEAYAVRHGRHLRSLILDSAADYPLWPTADLADGMAAVERICQRSDRCSSVIRHPRREVAWLARRLRRKPVRGIGFDTAGKPRRQDISETDLVTWFLLDQTGADRAQAELPAAARALRNGDSVPLLRMAARVGLERVDWSRTLGFEDGDTAAAFAGAICSEWPLPFDRSAAPAVRRQQARAALDALPDDVFAPFSREAVAPAWPFPECLEWPAPGSRNPILPAGASYWSGPTLILAGDLNVLHGPTLARKVSSRYANGRFVSIPNAAQAAFGWGACSTRVIDTFLTKLTTGSTRCARKDQAAFPGVGGFPRSVAGYRPARRASAADRSRKRDRRVAAAAVHTWLDAIFAATSSDATAGRGLRGGSWSVEWGPESAQFRLDGARFVQDVSVTGTPVLAYGPDNPPARLRVRGKGTAPGFIRLPKHAAFDPTRPSVRVSGRLGRRVLDLHVALH